MLKINTYKTYMIGTIGGSSGGNGWYRIGYSHTSMRFGKMSISITKEYNYSQNALFVFDIIFNSYYLYAGQNPIIYINKASTNISGIFSYNDYALRIVKDNSDPSKLYIDFKINNSTYIDPSSNDSYLFELHKYCDHYEDLAIQYDSPEKISFTLLEPTFYSADDTIREGESLLSISQLDPTISKNEIVSITRSSTNPFEGFLSIKKVNDIAFIEVAVNCIGNQITPNTTYIIGQLSSIRPSVYILYGLTSNDDSSLSIASSQYLLSIDAYGNISIITGNAVISTTIYLSLRVFEYMYM